MDIITIPEINTEQNSILNLQPDNTIDYNQNLVAPEPEVEIVEKVVNKNGRVKYNKIVERTIITDWLYAGFIIGGEAVVLATAVILFIVIHRKKTKKSM